MREQCVVDLQRGNLLAAALRNGEGSRILYGDVGLIDEDGFLALRGRVKDMINRCGTSRR